jgi:hypothetical protein
VDVSIGKTLIAFDPLSGSKTVRRAGVFSRGTRKMSRPLPCRAGKRLAAPAVALTAPHGNSRPV